MNSIELFFRKPPFHWKSLTYIHCEFSFTVCMPKTCPPRGGRRKEEQIPCDSIGFHWSAQRAPLYSNRFHYPPQFLFPFGLVRHSQHCVWSHAAITLSLLQKYFNAWQCSTVSACSRWAAVISFVSFPSKLFGSTGLEMVTEWVNLILPPPPKKPLIHMRASHN